MADIGFMLAGARGGGGGMGMPPWLAIGPGVRGGGGGGGGGMYCPAAEGCL